MSITKLFIVNNYTKQYYTIELYPNCQIGQYDYQFIVNKMNWSHYQLTIITEEEMSNLMSKYDKIDTYEIYTPCPKRRKLI